MDSVDHGDRMFQFSFSSGRNKQPRTLNVPVNVTDMKINEVPEFTARLLNFHNIPCFVGPGLNSSLTKFIKDECSELKNRRSSDCLAMIKENPNSIETIAKSLAEKYEKTWLRYSVPVSSNLNEFPLAYHYLIHSPAMQILLKLEKKYHSDLAKILVNKEQSLTKMQERHQLEMSRACEHVGFAYSNDDVTILASKHLEDAERLQSHWKNEYLTVTNNQKSKFRELVINLHKEMQGNNGRLDDSGPAYNKMKQIIDETVSVMRSSNGNTLFNNEEAGRSPNVSSTTGSTGTLMEESFTINLGAQLKTMHNIRLIVTDALNFCHYSDEGEMEAQRFQTAMSLYSSSLSALVILTDNRLGYNSSIQKEFSTICHSSTEFHFDSLKEQLAEIEKHAKQCENFDSSDEMKSEEETTFRLKDGDFYITKHSNLSQVHLVFHLVADEAKLQTKASLTNVTSRHPVVMSLRQILKVASSCDVRTITIPLLLTHELTEEITFQWCVKRAELVMKCMKGFMMEMAAWDGGVSRTVQFVVPPGVSEEVFDKIRCNLPEVFRTTTTRDLTRKKLLSR
ncbi:unnamed protein product [Clavelina lepadiformis]|uniref:Uncharacterized protein n=1 Tax=Clavelina lepadiformis TaxID=159417 RepID=A0ABP0GMT3_CLALP